MSCAHRPFWLLFLRAHARSGALLEARQHSSHALLNSLNYFRVQDRRHFHKLQPNPTFSPVHFAPVYLTFPTVTAMLQKTKVIVVFIYLNLNLCLRTPGGQQV